MRVGTLKQMTLLMKRGLTSKLQESWGKEFIDKLYTVEEANLDLENIEAMLEYQNNFLIYLTDDGFKN